MGYTTEFEGSLTLSRILTNEELEFINSLCTTRRMKRNVNKLMEIYKGEFGYPFATGTTPEEIYGIDGEYFVHEDDNPYDYDDPSIIDCNCPPGQLAWNEGEFGENGRINQIRVQELKAQPGLWCGWIISDDGDELMWDGGEKFYDYIEWLKYLIDRFFNKWNVMLNGEIMWQGEDRDDIGKIVVKDNVVKIFDGHYEYKETERDY